MLSTAAHKINLYPALLSYERGADHTDSLGTWSALIAHFRQNNTVMMLEPLSSFPTKPLTC